MTTIHTYQFADNKVIPTDVTCETTSGIGLYLTGLKDTATKESLLRAATALNSHGYHIPGRKIVINIKPANIGGETALLDCAIAAALALTDMEHPSNPECFVVGELALNGLLRSCGPLQEIVDYHTMHNPDKPLLFPMTMDIPETGNIIQIRNITEIISKFVKYPPLSIMGSQISRTETPFQVGDKVKWNDPAINDYDKEDRQDVLNRVFEIYDIRGEIICISDGTSEAEVFAHELVKL